MKKQYDDFKDDFYTYTPTPYFSLMPIIMACFMLIAAIIIFVITVTAPKDNFMHLIEKHGSYAVYYQTNTKVMYVQSEFSQVFTVLEKADGTPMIWDENEEKIAN